MRFDESQFIESLDGIPVEDLSWAIEQKCRRIENTSLSKQLPLDESTVSLLTFRRFLNTVMLGVPLTHHVLPAEHMPAYRKCVAKLVKSGKLPRRANEEFDKTFSASGKGL